MHYALAFLLLFASPVWALTVGNTSTTEGTANTTVTHTHTVATGTNRVLLVGVARQDSSGSPTVTGITFGGVALTAVTNGKSEGPNGWDDAEWWYLDNPAEGAANVVVTVTAATTANMGVFARDYSGCGSGGCTITGNYLDSGSTDLSTSVASISLENGDHALAAVTLAQSGRTTSWTNATEDYDDDYISMSYSFATRNSTTTETPTITATYSADPIRSALSIITVSAGNNVTFDAASYEPGDTATITASGFASAMTEVYLENVGESYDLSDRALNDLSSYFTRTSTASDVAADGSITSVASGTPAFNGANGIYLEDAETNSAPRSKVLDGTGWTDVNVTSSNSAIASRDGSGFLQTISADNSNGTRIQTSSTVALTNGSLNTVSFDVAAGTADHVSIVATSSSVGAVLDLTNLTVDQNTGADYHSAGIKLVDATNSIYRVWMVIDSTRASDTIGIGPSDGTGFAFGHYPNGSSGDTVHVDLAQVEVSGHPTSYIPTSGSTVTRNATALDDIPIELDVTNGVALWMKVRPNFASADTRADNRIVFDGDASNLFDVSFSTTSNVVSFRRRAGGSDTETAAVTVTGGWDYQEELILAFRADSSGIEARVKADGSWYTASTSDGTDLSTAVADLDVGNIGLVSDIHVWTGTGIPSDADLALFSLSGDYNGVLTVESGATSSSADVILPDLTAYLPGGTHQQLPFGDAIYASVTDGTSVLMDSYTNDQPANSTSSYYTSNVLCSTGSCPADSLAETSTPTLTNMVSGDDALCRATSGTFTTINDYLVPMYPGAVTINCRYFDESLQAWSAESTKSLTISSSGDCIGLSSSINRTINQPIHVAVSCGATY